ncbi:hypothetical protein CPB84DRAFT_874932 [Gymnopilus junonius]|uniref:Uncharacterized protein n=1 Tax=Gymnopilus junonius TaxID=109634 RepID=A0A9P5NPJ6_GYMJU|nr:hypothetical protein CPB84DRAFT_874932 [Gymnopilus junonius]
MAWRTRTLVLTQRSHRHSCCTVYSYISLSVALALLPALCARNCYRRPLFWWTPSGPGQVFANTKCSWVVTRHRFIVAGAICLLQ